MSAVTNTFVHANESTAVSMPSTPFIMPTLPPSGNHPSYKAVRLINTKDMAHEDWLGVRQQGIGSSDASAAVGLNPYKSQLELWLEKTGRITQPAISAEGEDSNPMYWGTVLEAVVAKHYQKRTGHRVRRVNAVLQHPDYSFMLANVDREVVGSDVVQLLECKTAGAYGAKLWAEGVPEYVQLQVQHQLAVTGKQSADVAVLIAGQEFRIYQIDRDEALIRHLIELEAQFWCYVEEDTPPPADGSESAQKALQRLYPLDSGSVLDFKEFHELSDLFAQLVQVRHQLDDLEAKEQWLKQQLQGYMGMASKALFATGSISWKKTKDSWQLDSKRLLQDKPELLDQYGVLRPGSRRFLVSVD